MKRFLPASFLFVLSAFSALTASADLRPDTTIVNHIMADEIIVVEQPAALTSRLKMGGATAAQVAETNVPETAQQPTASGSNEVKTAAESTTDNASAPASAPASTGNIAKTAGYRVLVFSDGNTKTAKNEARSKAQNISSKLPKYRTYVSYTSPYWRLKVGDFLTRQEAENAADEIKKLFPAYAREVRVVTDRVNASR